MSEINDLIRSKLKDFPDDVYELGLAAIQAAEKGIPEVSIAEHLAGVVKSIAKKKGAE